jgi:hypothetical protein
MGQKMKKIRLLFPVVFLLFIQSGLTQGILFHGTLRNSIYSYESTETHTRYYQYLHFNVVSPCRKIILDGSVRALTDANVTLPNDDRFKAYALNVTLKDIFWQRVDVTAGRQFLHPGTVLGGLDGVNGTWRIVKNLSLQFYGGYESQYERSFKAPEDDAMAFGGLLQLAKKYASTWQVFYLQKSRNNKTACQIAGININSAILPRTVIQFQTHYDFQNTRIHRMYVSARHNVSTALQVNAAFKVQQPQIYSNSVFTFLELGAYTQFRAGTTWEFIPGYRAGCDLQFIESEGTADKVYLTLANNNGSVGLIFESGFAGDQLGVCFDYSYELFKGFLASIYMDYSKYRLEQVYEYDNQLSNAMRLSYRLGRHFGVDVEYQWLTNKVKEQDSRFLNHLSYRW